jgi:hypothetical protein
MFTRLRMVGLLLSLAGLAAISGACSRANQDSPLGTNVIRVVNGSGDWPFVDAFKASSEWLGGFNEQSLPFTVTVDVEEDEHGWVRFLPAAGEAAFDAVETTMFRNVQGHFPAGQYTVLYDGTGTLTYLGDVAGVDVSVAGHHVFTVTMPSNDGIRLRITATDPEGRGDYVRNIRVIMPGFEDSYGTQVFHPLFVQKLQPFKVLRFMDWMRTNDSGQGTWSQRPRVDDARYSTLAGVPLEVMVDLSNRLHTDVWFSMPHMATDEYVMEFATLVRMTLASGRRVYVEYSNEVWNGIFDQADWVTLQAEAEWPPPPNPPQSDAAMRRMNWYGKRTAEICDIWKSVWAEQDERVICVMSAQATRSETAEWALACELWTEGTPCEHHQIDALAIAPYFGGHIGRQQHENTVVGWTQASDGGLDQLFTELSAGGLLTGTQTDTLPQVYTRIADYVQLAANHNLPLIAYEGGQHVTEVITPADPETPALTQLFTTANRDERMGELYTEYFDQWKALGGRLFVHHINTRRYNQSGSYGALEYADQVTTPKYTALIQFIVDNPCWWPHCAGVETAIPAGPTSLAPP